MLKCPKVYLVGRGARGFVAQNHRGREGRNLKLKKQDGGSAQCVCRRGHATATNIGALHPLAVRQVATPRP
jgi:hypothetical protein